MTVHTARDHERTEGETPGGIGEPGEPGYSPLWRETIVRWKSSVIPTLIKSDTRVDALIDAGKVTERGER